MTAQLWVFAGPNGAGKTTIVDRHVAGRIPVINPMRAYCTMHSYVAKLYTDNRRVDELS